MVAAFTVALTASNLLKAVETMTSEEKYVRELWFGKHELRE